MNRIARQKTLRLVVPIALVLVTTAIVGHLASDQPSSQVSSWIKGAFPSVLSNASRSLPRGVEQVVAQNFRASSREDRIRMVKYAPLEIEAMQSEAGSHQAILQLKLGLEDQESEIRDTAAASVESTLIDLAHGLVAFPEPTREELDRLFSIYKRQATDRVARTKAINPRSPTLTYLERL